MATDAGWGRRLRAARRAWEERHDRSLPYREIGERVGAVLKRAPFAHPTVRAWFMEGQEPDSFAVARAIAVVLESDAGELITGDKKPAGEGGRDEDYTAGAVQLTEVELDRAERQAAIDEAALAAKSAPHAPQRKRAGKKDRGA